MDDSNTPRSLESRPDRVLPFYCPASYYANEPHSFILVIPRSFLHELVWPRKPGDRIDFPYVECEDCKEKIPLREMTVR